MSHSIKTQFETEGSTYGVPPSPADGTTPEAVSQIGFSRLHNQYSNLGDPMISMPAYTNFGASTISYTNPQTSLFGLTANSYQQNSKYRDNLPAGSHF